MTPGGPSPAGGPAAGPGWTRREKDIIFRRLGGPPHPGNGRDDVPPPRVRGAVASDARRRGTSTRTVALALFALILLALIMAALFATDRSGAPEPRVAARAPADAPARSEADEPTAIDTAEVVLAPAGAGQAAAPAGAGEAVVRAFYDALGRGDGAAASAQVVPEKRATRAFSPEAISRFYGGLPEPLRRVGVTALAPDRFRVRYRYSAGRIPCDGEAVVTLASRDGRDLIQSIRARGC